jgi:hypothetical protein
MASTVHATGFTKASVQQLTSEESGKCVSCGKAAVGNTAFKVNDCGHIIHGNCLIEAINDGTANVSGKQFTLVSPGTGESDSEACETRITGTITINEVDDGFSADRKEKAPSKSSGTDTVHEDGDNDDGDDDAPVNWTKRCGDYCSTARKYIADHIPDRRQVRNLGLATVVGLTAYGLSQWGNSDDQSAVNPAAWWS